MCGRSGLNHTIFVHIHSRGDFLRTSSLTTLVSAESGLISLFASWCRRDGHLAGVLGGVMNAQTEAALRQYQQKQGLPVSGAADEATLKQL
jgi:peptidoglycan hydrolase-like protein with peptidoglycan-binding domain